MLVVMSDWLSSSSEDKISFRQVSCLTTHSFQPRQLDTRTLLFLVRREIRAREEAKLFTESITRPASGYRFTDNESERTPPWASSTNGAFRRHGVLFPSGKPVTRRQWRRILTHNAKKTRHVHWRIMAHLHTIIANLNLIISLRDIVFHSFNSPKNEIHEMHLFISASMNVARGFWCLQEH